MVQFPEADRTDRPGRALPENDRNLASAGRPLWGEMRRPRGRADGLLAFRRRPPNPWRPPPLDPNDFHWPRPERPWPTCSNSDRGRRPNRGPAPRIDPDLGPIA